MVDFSKYEEVKAGARQQTKVASVTEGTQEDFRSERYWEHIEDTPDNIAKMKVQPAIEVKTYNGASMVLNMPLANLISPKSNLAAWKRTYGAYPFVGQEVSTKVDEKGFNRVVLEV